MLGDKFSTPLGKAHQKMSQWWAVQGPAERKDEIKEGLRFELANHLDDLRDKKTNASEIQSLKNYTQSPMILT